MKQKARRFEEEGGVVVLDNNTRLKTGEVFVDRESAAAAVSDATASVDAAGGHGNIAAIGAVAACPVREYVTKTAQRLSAMNAQAMKDSMSLPEYLSRALPMTPETIANMLQIVPWDGGSGVGSLVQVPAKTQKGNLHVTMLAYNDKALHGGGLYAADAILWLMNAEVPLKLPRLEIQPAAVA